MLQNCFQDYSDRPASVIASSLIDTLAYAQPSTTDSARLSSSAPDLFHGYDMLEPWTERSRSDDSSAPPAGIKPSPPAQRPNKVVDFRRGARGGRGAAAKNQRIRRGSDNGVNRRSALDSHISLRSIQAVRPIWSDAQSECSGPGGSSPQLIPDTVIDAGCGQRHAGVEQSAGSRTMRPVGARALLPGATSGSAGADRPASRSITMSMTSAGAPPADNTILSRGASVTAPRFQVGVSSAGTHVSSLQVNGSFPVSSAADPQTYRSTKAQMPDALIPVLNAPAATSSTREPVELEPAASRDGSSGGHNLVDSLLEPLPSRPTIFDAETRAVLEAPHDVMEWVPPAPHNLLPPLQP